MKARYCCSLVAWCGGCKRLVLRCLGMLPLLPAGRARKKARSCCSLIALCGGCRRLALRCLGLFPLLPAGQATLGQATAVAAALLHDPHAGVCAEAVRVLASLAIVYGVAGVNAAACAAQVAWRHAGEWLAGGWVPLRPPSRNHCPLLSLDVQLLVRVLHGVW